ncbi:MAG: hypothetical protein JSW37_14180, partial [Anaerolineales bacterium]
AVIGVVVGRPVGAIVGAAVGGIVGAVVGATARVSVGLGAGVAVGGTALHPATHSMTKRVSSLTFFIVPLLLHSCRMRSTVSPAIGTASTAVRYRLLVLSSPSGRQPARQ